jgi:hypothetical protein
MQLRSLREKQVAVYSVLLASFSICRAWFAKFFNDSVGVVMETHNILPARVAARCECLSS